MRNTVLSICDITGIMVQPWLDAGYEAILVDPQHRGGVVREGRVTKVGHILDSPAAWETIRQRLENLAFVAAFPPCTDLAVSGARWFSDKEKRDPNFQHKAMQVVWHCHAIAELSGAPWMIENPVSRISTFWRKPNHIFHPFWFTGHSKEDNYTKKTCLWTGGGFVMPEPYKNLSLPEPDNRIHAAPPGPDRANFRSATPAGFAHAVYEANTQK